MVIKVAARVRGEEIHVQFPFNRDVADWMKEEISTRRWAEPEEMGLSIGAWILPATDTAAYQLAKTCPLELVAGEDFWVLAKSFVDDANYAPESLPKGLPQPPMQHFNCWDHQTPAYHFAMKRLDGGKGAMLSMGMGTGKTKVAIDVMVNRAAKLVLVLCPASVRGVWRREVRMHSPDSQCLVLDKGTVKDKLKLAEAFATARKYSQSPRPWFIVVNYDSAIREDFTKWIMNQVWCGGILDESHRAKNANGVTGKMVKNLRLKCRDRLALTGTPMNTPADIFSQFRYLDATIFGGEFTRFKRRYAITGQFGEYLGWKRKSELRDRFHSGAIVISSDVLDLPEVQHLEREFSLPTKVQKTYKSLWDDLIAEVEGGVCTADNALVKLLRCQQITSGYLPLDEEIDPFDDNDWEAKRVPTKFVHLHDEKKKLLTEILTDANPDEPIIVFCRFRHDLDVVKDVVEGLFNIGHTYGEISGRPGRKKDLTPDATLPEGISVFGVQIASGGVGVDFSRSCLSILYSIDFSLNIYEQMLKRTHRPGQTKNVRYYHFIAKKTVDRKILQSLKSKRNIVAEVTRAIEAGEISLGGDEE